MLSKQTLSSKIALIALALLMIFLGNLKYKQWKSQRQIEAEKLSLQDQADRLQKKNDELNQSLQYLNSTGFKERVARDQLGLKKEGEQVYSFSDAPQVAGATTDKQNAPGNVQKWWDYFFTN